LCPRLEEDFGSTKRHELPGTAPRLSGSELGQDQAVNTPPSLRERHVAGDESGDDADEVACSDNRTSRMEKRKGGGPAAALLPDCCRICSR
jgi:hypothetical protein